MSALDLFSPAGLVRRRARAPPAGFLSSRGCPAACTFCSNDVTGRKFRDRSAASVSTEVRLFVERFGQRAFSFFADSFAVGRRRIAELCAALKSSGAGPVYWTCTAHPAHLDRATLIVKSATRAPSTHYVARMQFGSDDNADSSAVEDRRGSRFGGPLMLGGGGLGIVGVVIYILIQVLGGGGGGGGGGGSADNDVPTSGQPPATAPANPEALGGSCQGVTSTSDPAKFVSCVVSSVQRFWGKDFATRDRAYEPAHLVLFTEATASACGTASARTGPFYCPRDKKVYLDLGFFQELSRRFGAKGGDFAEAYVIAHEYGHHVQDLLGTERKMRVASAQNPSEGNHLSVKLELQADCLAGVWGHAAYDRGNVSSTEIEQALDAAAAIGDDRIEKQTTGQVRPETFTHGSSAERQHWFSAGFHTGDSSSCDTFAE